ncbi:hypothetical protein PV325_004369 [Microctonus aethiopoides]|nr:hypothetical protein PV325_004369 [Microctonus aethiopoides]
MRRRPRRQFDLRWDEECQYLIEDWTSPFEIVDHRRSKTDGGNVSSMRGFSFSHWDCSGKPDRNVAPTPTLYAANIADGLTLGETLTINLTISDKPKVAPERFSKTGIPFPHDSAEGYVNWVDLIVPIGGDGTFLLTSKLITNNVKPMIGINPNQEEYGNLTLPYKYSSDIATIFEMLLGADGLQRRIRVLPWLALNEVFMGEFMAARTSTMSFQADGKTECKIRSSGMCAFVSFATGKDFDDANIDDVQAIRSNITFNPVRIMRYRLKVKFRGLNAGSILDGSISLAFNDITTTVFEIHPGYAFKTIQLK